MNARRAAAAIVLAAAAIALVLLVDREDSTAPAAGDPLGFERRQIEIAREALFELGVTDYDDDGRSDVFTTNHSHVSSLLRNTGDGGFSEQIFASGLDQEPSFPGLADLTRPPDFERSGIYLFASPGARYELRRVGELEPGIEPRGTLEFRSDVRIPEELGVEIELSRDRRADPPVRRIEFDLREPGARLIVSPPFLDVPVRVSFDRSVPLDRVFVGSQGVQPQRRSFELRVPDRHGIAFADIDGDSQSDAWVISGGNRARIDEFRGLIQDELFLGDGSGFVERRERAGIEKGSCRGRTAAAIDYDGDGDLDLFQSCADAAPKLYRQGADGTFTDASEDLGEGDSVEGSEYRWLDLSGDPRPELVIARRSEFSVRSYDPGSGGFVELDEVERRPGSRLVRRLAPADFDNDGDLDLYATSTGTGTLLRNDEGRLRPLAPQRLGLPKRAVAAAWVDYDNDGRTDLHLVPQGIYRQEPGGRFAETGLAALPDGASAYVATAWFDLENDGDRDLLAGFKSGDESARTVELLENVVDGGHWLHVDLEGEEPNTDAIGAEVELRVGGRRLTGQVGQSDGTRHSRGDHRLYFGLGERDRVDRLTVRWPDGSRSVRRDVAADQILRIAR